MLDMGFAEDLETLLSARPADAPDGALLGHDLAADRADRQAPPERPGPGHDPARDEERGAASRVRQVAYVVRRADKLTALGRILDVEDPRRRSSSPAPAARSRSSPSSSPAAAMTPPRSTAAWRRTSATAS